MNRQLRMHGFVDRLYEYRLRRRVGWQALVLAGTLRDKVVAPLIVRAPRSWPELRFRLRTAHVIRLAQQTDPVFPAAPTPRVSVVIPVFNNWSLTRDCLASLSPVAIERTDLQLIVVDDGSTDATPAALDAIANVTVVTNSPNVGFTLAASRGAEAARGEFIFFLNNDALVFPDCINVMVETMATPSVGAVGAKLVYPNGVLQEAGAHMCPDGTNWNIGRNSRATRRRYNVPREVDYCSAAALLVRTTLLKNLGYFDAQFAPGYYEDVDLCFSIRAKGYRVVYEPRAVAVHRESMTHGFGATPAVPGARGREVVERNRQRFVRKWDEELRSRTSCLSEHR